MEELKHDAVRRIEKDRDFLRDALFGARSQAEDAYRRALQDAAEFALRNLGARERERIHDGILALDPASPFRGCR